MISVDVSKMPEIGQNVKCELIDGLLVFVVDPKQDLGPSSTGKMRGVANTGGFTTITGGMKLNLYLGKKV